MDKKRARCAGCGEYITVNKDGRLRAHEGDMLAPGGKCSQVRPAPHPTLIACACGKVWEGDPEGGHGALECLSDPAPTVEETTTGDDVNDTDQTKLDDAFGAEFDDPETVPATSGPVRQADPRGPWFGAMYPGRCSSCEDRFAEGDRIRADGTGGYECADCGEHPWAQDDELREHVKAAPRLTGADQFDDPAAVEPKPVMSVSGQPKKVLRDHLDRYAVVLPGETELERYKSSGNPVGRTRATTFNKAATDKKNINDWGKRNVLIGASRRRDLVLQATGLTHEDDKDRLNALVIQLEETAGSKVGSDLGTYLHDFTEYMDAGLKTWRDAPEQFQKSLALYAHALERAGLVPIRSLIERTTIIREYGWVCGTFDRIFYHRPSGQYLIGDLKTGKTMDYGKNEIECQLWTYAHGVNQNGVYDWNTQTWEKPDAGPDLPVVMRVSEKVGVVIHMPVQGELEGTVELLWADLESGAAHAEVCAAVRARPNGRMKPWGDGPAPLARPAGPDWEALFADVTDQLEATKRWREAKAAGITGVRLNELIAIARRSLESGS